MTMGDELLRGCAVVVVVVVVGVSVCFDAGWLHFGARLRTDGNVKQGLDFYRHLPDRHGELSYALGDDESDMQGHRAELMVLARWYSMYKISVSRCFKGIWLQVDRSPPHRLAQGPSTQQQVFRDSLREHDGSISQRR